MCCGVLSIAVLAEPSACTSIHGARLWMETDDGAGEADVGSGSRLPATAAGSCRSRPRAFAEKLGALASAAVPDLVAVLDRLRGTEHTPLQKPLSGGAAVEPIGTASRSRAGHSLAKPRTAPSTLLPDLAVKRSTEQILASPESQMIDTLMQQLLSRDVDTRLKAAKSLAGTLAPLREPPFRRSPAFLPTPTTTFAARGTTRFGRFSQMCSHRRRTSAPWRSISATRTRTGGCWLPARWAASARPRRDCRRGLGGTAGSTPTPTFAALWPKRSRACGGADCAAGTVILRVVRSRNERTTRYHFG